MKKRQNLYLILLTLTLFTTACQRENDKNPALLGKWQGAEWLIFDKPSGQDATRVHFEFKEDGVYSADFGTQAENGVWRTVGDKLYTTGTGRKEIMVKILSVDATNMKFEMNRGGQKETIAFIKIQ